MGEAAYKFDTEAVDKANDRANSTLDAQVKTISKTKKVTVTFNKLVGNMHATKAVLDSLIHLIRFSENRRYSSPFLVGYSLPNEEIEKTNMFFAKFGQDIVFYPDREYQLPEKEALKYQVTFGKYKEVYTGGPIFFSNEEDYQRSLDEKFYVEIK